MDLNVNLILKEMVKQLRAEIFMKPPSPSASMR
jgi:hypothetical protein